MSSVALVSITAADRVGLVSAIAGRLYDLGINLRDTTFATLGQGADFTAVCEMPGDLDLDALRAALIDLPELEGGSVQVSPYQFDAKSGPDARITHRFEFDGGDQLGLIARLAEVFREYGANIVRMEAQTLHSAGGDRYVTRFAVCLPKAREETCIAAVSNTAGSLRLEWGVREE